MNDNEEVGKEENGEEMIEFQSNASQIARRVEEHARTVGEVSDQLSEVLGKILVSEVEEYLREQDSSKGE